MKSFEAQLTGGHPNSLGNTLSVVEQVLADPASMDELYHCYYSDDEVVRLRVSNAMKRICTARKSLILPYVDRLLTDISRIDQASTQWTLAQLFDLLEKDLTGAQRRQARAIMERNLANHNDWIVLNMTMKTLGKWAKKDEKLRDRLRPELERIAQDKRTSVKKGANKLLASLYG